MPNTINLRLLDNKNIIAELNGIPLANENSYKIIAGEENATIFNIKSKPAKYQDARYTVEMVNSQGYGIAETDIDNSFVLPIGMAVAGYGYIQIRAYLGEEKVPFMTLKVKIWNTLPNWKENVSEESVDLTDYVKNTDYATENKAGVVRVIGAQGIGINNGGLYINPSNTYLLQQQTSMYNPVVPSNVAMAVKQGLINPNKSTSYPANWTEEEKTSARNTLGAGRKLYRHDIETDIGSGYIISTNSEVYSGFVGGSSENVKEIIYVCVVESAGIFIGFGTFSDTGFSGIRLLQNGGYTATSPAIQVNSDIVTEL